VRLIGRGSMGEVYESVHPLTQVRVAVKIIAPGLWASSDSGGLRERFRREAAAVSALTHPGIVRAYEYVEDAGQAYIVMEYVEGRSLRDDLSRGVVFSLTRTVELMSQLLDALHYAHSRGVCHRDIKPSNILIDRSGGPRIVDFGLASATAGAVDEGDEVLGTPGYIAPETYLATESDCRVDVFAAGAVLYELLTGRAAFAGTRESIMMQTCYESVSPPSATTGLAALRPYDSVLARALAKRPEERFKSANEFRAALVEACQ
jgi:eukaryotic-like serine/threonine-protein kinase